jgi:tetratricopeptide (TPR) repeat protein
MLNLRDAAKKDLVSVAQATSGIPRALEMVAGILHGDRTATLAELLNNQRLFGEQVVEQLVAEGHQRLSPDERRVMEALGVYNTPVEQAAIAHLLGPWFPDLDVRSSLAALTNGYFVGLSAKTREYSLHPLDREYAYCQLAEDWPKDGYSRRNLERRAADYYAGIRKSKSEWRSVDDLAPQLAEFGHRVRGGQYDEACHLLDLIDDSYLARWGYYARLIELRQELLGKLEAPELQAHNLGNLGRAYRDMGQVGTAIPLYEEALDITRRLGDRRGEGTWLGRLGAAYRNQGDTELAIQLLNKALVVAHEIDVQEEEWLQLVLSNLSRAYRSSAQVQLAVEFGERALGLAQDLGRPRLTSAALGHLGVVYQDLGQFERATALYKEALAIARTTRDRRRQGLWFGCLGHVHLRLGETGRATGYYDRALVISREIGDRRQESIYTSSQAEIFRVKGQLGEAERLFEHSLALSREIENLYEEGYQLMGLGRTLLAQGKIRESIDCLQRALDIRQSETRYKAALALGIAYLHSQSIENAKETFAKASLLCRSRLKKTETLYDSRYSLAAARAGRAVCEPAWAEANRHVELLTPTMTEYRHALDNCSAKGVVQDARRDLELIRAAGIEGLEPVFELLESAIEDESGSTLSLIEATEQ